VQALGAEQSGGFGERGQLFEGDLPRRDRTVRERPEPAVRVEVDPLRRNDASEFARLCGDRFGRLEFVRARI
jgi:hypothetical protein